LGKLSFVDATHGWATGWDFTGEYAGDFVVVKTTDGGVTWKRQKGFAAFNGTGIDVQFVSRSRGIWICSYILLTNDGGKHWGKLRKRWGASFVDFATPSVAWVVGTGGSGGTGRYIARTTNGGTTWRTQLAQPRAAMAAPRALSAPTRSTAYMISRGLWVTRNGGASWARMKTNIRFGRQGWSLNFPTRLTGWALNVTRSVLRKTTDGGRHWARRSSDASQDLLAMDFVSRRTGWVTGTHGAVYRTRDGGVSWSSLQVPTSADLLSVDFVDSNHGLVVGGADLGEDNLLFRTVDGGDSWQRLR
jgi:photosystem II stability/assembly factor-like uncharacterized protein